MSKKLSTASNLRDSHGRGGGVSSMTMERDNKGEEDDTQRVLGSGENHFLMEDSPSYEILQQHQLLTKKYRLAHEDELDVIKANSTRCWNTTTCILCCPCSCMRWFTNFEVPNGNVLTGYDGRGNYKFYGPGVHQVVDPFSSFGKNSVLITSSLITHGDRTILTVGQGFIGFATERGQPILLPPGMHQWKSATLKFERFIDLNDPIIEIGPWTLLTIDQGYMAVTQNNGKQVILDGGSVYLLTHRNWKFEKFVSTKIQTNDLTRIEAASADNVIMLVDATVLWRISDVETAVRMSAETMAMESGTHHAKQTMVKLRNDVLKQAEASLAFFVGTINFSDSMAAAAINQRSRDDRINHTLAAAFRPDEVDFADGTNQTSPTTSGANTGGTEMMATAIEFNLYNNDKLRDAVSHANEITGSYGVEIISINIISAIPADKKLQESLAAGAVAAAEAQMMETTAQGKSRAMQIEAKAKANQTLIIARADGDADVVRARGAKEAGDLLATNPVSVELAKIERTGTALAGKGNHASFFFGAQSDHLAGLLGNSSVVPGRSAES